MPVVDFNQLFIEKGLVCPEGKSKIEYSVSTEPGLFVECRASKTAVPVWYLRLKNSAGTNTYKKIGAVPEVTLEQAIKRAKELRQAHVSQPSAAVAAVALSVVPTGASMTWEVFMRDHYMPHVEAYKRSAKRDESLYRVHIAPLYAKKALVSVSRREVEILHRTLRDKQGQSPASADHVIKLMRRALNLALEWEFIEANPLKGIKLFAEDNQVENYLDDASLQRLLVVLKADSNKVVAAIIMFLLSTGARLNEALTATWKNVDLERGVWKVDAKRSKSKKARQIPLNDSAVWILGQLGSKGVSEYLFPSPVTGEPYVTITRSWYRIRKAAGVEMRLHDLRHSFASLLVTNGRSLYEVQSILGHSDPKVTMRYAHLSVGTLKAAANAGSVLLGKAA